MTDEAAKLIMMLTGMVPGDNQIEALVKQRMDLMEGVSFEMLNGPLGKRFQAEALELTTKVVQDFRCDLLRLLKSMFSDEETARLMHMLEDPVWEKVLDAREKGSKMLFPYMAYINGKLFDLANELFSREGK